MSINWRALLLTSEWRAVSTAATFKLAYALHRFAEFQYQDGIRYLAEAAELMERAKTIQLELETA